MFLKQMAAAVSPSISSLREKKTVSGSSLPRSSRKSNRCLPSHGDIGLACIVGGNLNVFILNMHVEALLHILGVKEEDLAVKPLQLLPEGGVAVYYGSQ